MDPMKAYPPVKWLMIVILVFLICQACIYTVRGNSITCFKTLSCKGKCSKVEQWDKGISSHTGPHCHCDPSCTKFEDCCRDYRSFCGNQTVPSRSDPEFVCRRVNDAEPRIWMVESCPRSFKDKTVREKCSSRSKLRADIIADQIPVYNVFTNIHYKNKFCAKCHGVENNFAMFYFKLRIKCDIRPPPSLNSFQTLEYMLEYCASAQMELATDNFRRFCFPTINSCPANASAAARTECQQSLPAIVYSRPLQTNYRSIECMACHLSARETRNAECGPQTVGGNIFNPKSFEVIMNFNKLASGLQIDKDIINTCKEGYSYDDHLEICRQDTAGPTKGVTDKYRVKMWLSPLDGGKAANFSHAEFIQVLTTRFRVLEPQQIDVISLKIEDRSTAIMFDLHAEHHNVKQQQSNDSNDALDLNVLFNFNQSFELTIVDRPWRVFKVTTRRLSCTQSEVYHPGHYSIFPYNQTAVVNSSGVLDFLPLKQYYLVKKDEKMRLNESTLVVCRSFFGVLCNHSMLAAVDSEYTIFENKSLLFKPTGQWFDEGEYDMRDNTPWICTNYTFSKRGNESLAGRAHKPNIHVEIRRYMTIIGFSISILSLFLVLLTHGILRDLRTPLPGKNLMSLSLSLFLAHFWYLLGSGDTDKPMFCMATAYILHYLFLVSFGCTFIVAYDTRRTFSVKTIKAHNIGGSFQTKRLATYLVISWGVPFLFVATCATLDWLDAVAIGYGRGGACWIGNPTAMLVAFATPVGLVLVYNVVAFSQTVYAINNAKKQAQRVKSNHYTRPAIVKIYMRLVSLMGFSWFFAISAPLIHHGLMYPFVFFTTLQGLYIFLAFVFKTKVLRMVKAKLPLKKGKPIRRPTKGTISTMADSTPYNKYTPSLNDETQI